MVPSCTKQNTARLVPHNPDDRVKFWTGYRAALVDAETHGRGELLAMAEFELSHAKKDADLSLIKLPPCSSN